VTTGDALVVGARGLIGSAVLRRLRAGGVSARAAAVSWHGDTAADDLRRAAASVDPHGAGVFWCAGAGVNGMTAEDTDRELRHFSAFLGALPGTVPVFLASSAGGVYSGSPDAPFETSPPVPLAEYGRAKLAMESAARDWADTTGGRLVVGRLANVYGPGQDLSKAQGLVSQLLRGSLLSRAVSIYVPLDTMRDYVYVDDVAQQIVALMRPPAPGATLKVLCSGSSTTVATLISTVRTVTGRRSPILLGDSPLRGTQVGDLRLRSVVDTDVVPSSVTSLEVGVSRTWQDMLERFAGGSLPGR